MDRLRRLGARPLREIRGDDGRLWWTIMADIEGNEFCAFRPPDEWALHPALAAEVNKLSGHCGQHEAHAKGEGAGTGDVAHQPAEGHAEKTSDEGPGH